MERREANAREVHGIEFLAALDAQLAEHERYLEERLRTAGVWRNYRLARSSVEKSLDAVYETLPDKTLLHMQRLCQNGEVVIRPKRQAIKTDDVQIVPTDALKRMINICIQAECAMCLRDRAEVKKCELRMALMLIAPVEKLLHDGGCPYMEVVRGNDYGKYI